MLVFAVIGIALTGGAFAEPVDGNVGGQPKAEEAAPQPTPSPQPQDLSTIEGLMERIARAIEAQPQTADTEQERDRAVRDVDAQEAMAFWAKWMTWATVGGVLVGFTSLVLLTLAVIYAKQAAVAAADAAKAAQDTVAETRRIGEAQVRAYISWDGSHMGMMIDDQRNIVGCGFAPQVKNTGQSPAVLVELYSHLALLNPDKVPDIKFKTAGAACNHTIGAGNALELAELLLSKERAASVFRRQERCYILGWAAYRDIFSKDGDPDHTITFCCEIKFRTSPDLWTEQYCKQNPLKNITIVTTIPDYQIRPDRSAS